MLAQDLAARIALAGLTPEDCALLPEAFSRILPKLDAMLDDFYAAAAAVPVLAKLVQGQVPRLKAAQRGHWEEIFRGRFDEDYLRRAIAIGRTHYRIGLEPHWYTAGYTRLLARMSALLIEELRRKPKLAAAMIGAVEKAILIDMAVAVSVYIQAGDENLRTRLGETADEIGSEIATAIAETGDRAEQVRRLTDETCAATSRMTGQAEQTRSLTEETSDRVTAVAAAAAQLSTAVKEIADATGRSMAVAEDAMAKAGQASTTIAALSGAVTRIDHVVKLIAEVAQQTNMLALNATIEAARAGAAGKGFAVVASEVKQLAGQTGRATEEIRRQTAEVEKITASAVAAVGEVTEAIRVMQDGTVSISAAAEQQAAATGEISASMASIRDQTVQVSGNAAGLMAGSAAAKQQTEVVRAEFAGVTGGVKLLSDRVSGILHRLRDPNARKASQSAPAPHWAAE